MVAPSVGAVVLVNFPFSDLTRSKRRPAIVLSDSGRNDEILCQVTSRSYADPRAVQISLTDLANGSLNRISYARPGKLFTANAGIMNRNLAELKPEKFEEIIQVVVSVFEASLA